MKKKSKFWGFDLEPWVVRALTEKPSGKRAFAYIMSSKTPKIPKGYDQKLNQWQRDSFGKKPHAMQAFDVADGVLFFVSPLLSSLESESDSQLKTSPRARYRDQVGMLLQVCERADIGSLEITFETTDPDELAAAIMGLEIASYRYKRTRKGESLSLALSLNAKGKAISSKIIGAGATLGVGINLARHLTNLPANDLNPETYAGVVQAIFAGSAVKVEVWNEARLRKERMNLLVAVGQGAVAAPALVQLKYRKGAKGAKPFAIVGKGITFDTGGVNLKPASAMRIMKKDMGGSAAVVGLMYWAAFGGVNLPPIDSYLALAENAIDGKSFRPGDVIVARSGQSVEIHNTDAEGRLVLADAMDVAIEAEPRALIDIATLTGAIKGALGASLAGLFANDAKLSRSIHQASQDVGDFCWPMPLYQKYRSQLSSHKGDVVNASDGFGGAITAALFLESYAGNLPWAHLDIYAWRDSSEGAWSEPGGSGQGVQLLSEWLAHHV